MGDEGRIYVDEDVIPAYRGLLRDADLILPNQFELEYGQPRLQSANADNMLVGCSRRSKSDRRAISRRLSGSSTRIIAFPTSL